MRLTNIKNVEIILVAEEVLQDIRNEGFIQSSVVDDASEVKTVLKDIVEQTNIEKVRRELDLAISELNDTLYPFTKNIQEFPLQASTDKYAETELYRISLLLPCDFAQVSVDYMKRLCHEYAKARCMQEFTRVVLPVVSESWQNKSDELLQQLDHVKNRRIAGLNNRVRRRGTVMI